MVRPFSKANGPQIGLPSDQMTRWQTVPPSTMALKAFSVTRSWDGSKNGFPLLNYSFNIKHVLWGGGLKRTRKKWRGEKNFVNSNESLEKNIVKIFVLKWKQVQCSVCCISRTIEVLNTVSIPKYKTPNLVYRTRNIITYNTNIT